MTAKLSRVELLLERLEAQGASPAYSFFVAFLVSCTAATLYVYILSMFTTSCVDAFDNYKLEQYLSTVNIDGDTVSRLVHVQL
jgi:hypothetical protein